MPATQQDNDDRWQLALDLGRESNAAIIELRKMVQRGFEDIARGQIEVRGRVLTVENDIKALRASDQDCQQRLAKLEADGAARAVLMKWLLTFGMINAIGAVIVAVLLLYMLFRLFSITG